jgi:hypothetical protein
LPSVTTISVTGNTSGFVDDADGNCQFGSGGEDVMWSFTAPEAGTYEVHTLNSAIDTVVYVLDSCGGSILACDDDVSFSDGVYASGLYVDLEAGETVLIVVDSWDSASSGAYTLSVEKFVPQSCDFDVAGAGLVSGSTAASGDDSSAFCGGAGGHDVSVLWSAPSDGLFAFDTLGTPFDTVLYIQDPACGGLQLACNDDFGGAAASTVFVPLFAGQEIGIVVDGYDPPSAGDFQVNVTNLDATGSCCAAQSQGGCNDVAVMQCVCDVGPSCCATEWSTECAQAAAFCGASC